MPHEVIMPALGMAQDTGLIVAWRKAPGDKVSVGDVLMEVETDKATMEVEAQADGYLTDVRAGEGDNVPVGDRVATISDTPDEPAADAADPEPEAVSDTPIPGAEVIMPALGMAQDTGLIVAWRKAPGDNVAAGDILLEVETDKSVMEVEAGHDGYVAELRAEAGENVPVGDVIAVITADKPAAPAQRSAAKKQPQKQTEKQLSKQQTSTNTEALPRPEPTKIRPLTGRDGRILASPKAKRLAAERGLDLARLVAEGVAQPYHVADLDRLAALPASHAGAAPAAAMPDRIEARVPNAGFAAFRTWLAEETGRAVDDCAIWAAFASASLREALSARDEPLIVAVRRIGDGSAAVFADADALGLNEIAPTSADVTPAIVVRDLAGSRLTSARFGVYATPALTISDNGSEFEIALEAPAGLLEPEAALSLVHEMAARLDEPLRHLL